MKNSSRSFAVAGASSLVTLAAISGLIGLASSETGRANRDPASVSDFKSGLAKGIDTEKMATLRGPLTTKRLRAMGKGHGSVIIEIAAPGKGSIAAGSVLNLEATVEAKEDLAGLKYVWLLPKDGVTLLSGAVEGDLGNLALGETTTLSLSVASETAENRRIHLHVYRVVDGENRGQMAQYNTVDQEKIESHAEANAKALRLQHEAQGTTERLIQ